MVDTGVSRGDLNIQAVAWKGLTWINVDHPSRAEMEYLRERYSFHPLDLEDCLSRLQLPKIDEYPSYLFLVLHFPRFDHKARITQSSQVSIFVGADFLVTVHPGELRPLGKLFQDSLSSEEIRDGLMSQGSGQLLYKILDGLIDYCFPILHKISEQVDALEIQALDQNSRGNILEMAIIRRDIIAYRRIIRPQIEVMESLERKKYTLLKVDPQVYFGDLADHTRHMWIELEELKEVIEGLNDTIFTINTNLTNDVMRILTVIFTAMLPVVVISGIYGMNVPLPLGSNPGGNDVTFWLLILISLLLSGGLFAYFRYRRWI